MPDTEKPKLEETVSERFSQLRHLSDIPVSKDDFTGQAHSRTAKALVDVVLNDNDTVRAIGLEGAWGSGKSSVIEIARNELSRRKSDQTNYHLFTFDVWSHQGDPLRRAFLDKFIHWLGDERRINQEQKISWLDQIQAKITRTTTRTTPNLKLIGIVMVLLAPLLPLVYVWLSPLAFGKAMSGLELFGQPWQSSAIRRDQYSNRQVHSI